MAKLTAAQRKKLPDSKFAGPNRSYPIEDKDHAINAEARAEQQFRKGFLSASQRDAIKSKARKVIKKKR